MIIPDKNIIFIHIPKTAGTSIKDMLLREFVPNEISDLKDSFESVPRNHPVFDKYEYDHKTYSEYINELGDDILNYFVFTVVRNPWDRMVSLYHHFKRHPYHQKRKLAIAAKQGFENFVNTISDHQNSQELIRFQSGFITTDDKLLVPNIFRFETLEKDILKLREKFDIETPLRVENKSDRDLDYRSYYTSDLCEKVRQIFKQDIDILNYKYE